MHTIHLAVVIMIPLMFSMIRPRSSSTLSRSFSMGGLLSCLMSRLGIVIARDLIGWDRVGLVAITKDDRKSIDDDEEYQGSPTTTTKKAERSNQRSSLTTTLSRRKHPKTRTDTDLLSDHPQSFSSIRLSHIHAPRRVHHHRHIAF